MKRFNLSRRDKFYSQGGFYGAFPAVRIPVVPGQSGSMAVRCKFESANLTQNVLSGGIASLFMFYVPNRLVWERWTDFAAQEATGGPVPSTTTEYSAIWDTGRGTTDFLSFPRRAFKLAYNQFFGSLDFVQYADIEDDTDVSIKTVRTTEQFIGRLMKETTLATPTFDATTNPIDLNEFYRSMMSARSRRKAQMSGDKYVDALRRMGVEPDWRIQMAPEFLGRKDVDFRPVKTFKTSDADYGDTVARYEGTIDLNVPRKMFAEHGYIIGVFMMRPHISLGLAPMDGLRFAEYEDWYFGDNTRSQDEFPESDYVNTVGSSKMFSQRFAHLRNGQHLTRLGTWQNMYTATSGTNLVYPSWVSTTSDELPTDFAFLVETHLTGQTPVPPSAL